jgi:hypothetical protein
MENEKDHNLIAQFIGMLNVKNEYLIRMPLGLQ